VPNGSFSAKLGVELIWNQVAACFLMVCLLQQLHDGFLSNILETWWRNTSENIKITLAVEKKTLKLIPMDPCSPSENDHGT